jgi:hypothetical protein
MDALYSLGAAAAPAQETLLELLRAPGDAQDDAAEILFEIGRDQPTVTAAIVETLAGNVRSGEYGAAFTLTNLSADGLDGRRAIDALLHALEHGKPDLKLQAARALGYIAPDDPRAQQAILRSHLRILESGTGEDPMSASFTLGFLAKRLGTEDRRMVTRALRRYVDRSGFQRRASDFSLDELEDETGEPR